MGQVIEMRRRYGAGVLPYDARVEWLESTGTQWINTGIAALANATREIRVQAKALITSNVNNNTLVCIYDEVASSGFCLRYGKYTYLHYMFGKIRTRPMIGPRFVVRGQVFELDVSTDAATENDNDCPLVLFCALDSNMSPFRYSPGGRVYSLKVTVDGVERVNLIPVRVGDVGYMYDKVSRQLFGNMGTGTFVVGPDVVGGGL